MKMKFKKQTRILAGFLLIVILAMQLSCGMSRQREFDSNRRLWRESKITNYRMTVDLQKTGHATPMGKFIITVRGGEAESIKAVGSPEKDLKNGDIKFGRYDTIEKIFDYIENADNDKEGWDTRIVEYDSKLGYPKKVSLDKARVFDEELFFQVLQFEALE